MKRAPNRSGFDDTKPDQSLPRSKILRGRRNFQRLFTKSTVLTSDSIQFRYRLYDDPSEGCYIGFIAPKKTIRGAVQRNRAKRLMREVYRLHQDYLQDLFSNSVFGFHGVFLARQSSLTFNEIRDDMLPLLQKVRERLVHFSHSLPKEKPSTGTDNSSETKRT